MGYTDSTSEKRVSNKVIVKLEAFLAKQKKEYELIIKKDN